VVEQLTIQNHTGFIERLTERSLLGQVIDVLELVPSDQGDTGVGVVVGQVSVDDSYYDNSELQEQKKLLAESFGHINVPSRQKDLMHQLTMMMCLRYQMEKGVRQT